MAQPFPVDSLGHHAGSCARPVAFCLLGTVQNGVAGLRLPSERRQGFPILGFKVQATKQGIGRRKQGIGLLTGARAGVRAATPPFPRPSRDTSWRSRDFTVRIDFRSLPLAG